MARGHPASLDLRLRSCPSRTLIPPLTMRHNYMYAFGPHAPVLPQPNPVPVAIIGTIGWRLLIAGIAFAGFHLVAYSPGLGYRTATLWELNQLASLVAAAIYALLALLAMVSAGRWLEPWGSTWIRGAMAVTLLLVATISIFVIPGRGQLGEPGFLLEHLITPLLVVIDAIFVGRRQRRLRGWMPLTWVTLPLGYWVVLLMTGREQMYMGMLDPSNSEAPIYIGGFAGAAIGMSYGLYGLIRLRPREPDPFPTVGMGEYSPGPIPQPGMPRQTVPGPYPSPQTPGSSPGYPPVPAATGYDMPPRSVPEGPGPSDDNLSGLPEAPNPPAPSPAVPSHVRWPAGDQGSGQPGQTGRSGHPPPQQTPPPH